ncbi:MAG: hypothetical protein U1E76_13510 [Planctomycetota bacterium]
MLPLLLLALLQPTPSAGADEPARIDLKLLFIGTEHDVRNASGRAARTREFVSVLASRFASVRSADREHFDPAGAGDADVVLLDWSQQEIDLDQMAAVKSPLGPRASWHHPTVLLGSAGLLIAGPWQTQGAFG